VRRKPIITKLKFFEKPSRSERVSIGKLKKITLLYPGSFYFLSTSKFGIVSNFAALKNNAGGVLLYKIN